MLVRVIAAQPSKTALRVALRRAAHQVQDAKPLVFDDPLAIPILGPEHSEEIARTPNKLKRPFSAGLRAFMVARARFAEDTLQASVAAGVAKQYLVLGAGLDTFAYRNPHNDLKVFEVDHPATQAWKREKLAAAKIDIPVNLTFVAVDFEQQSLAAELAAAGFDPAQLTVIAWLGVVPYLTLDAFRATVQLIGTFAPGTELVFDYSYPRESLSATEKLMLDSLSARVAQAGEPFQLFFTQETLERELTAAGLTLVENVGSDGFNRRYFDSRSDGLRLRGHAGHLCHAAVKTMS